VTLSNFCALLSLSVEYPTTKAEGVDVVPNPDLDGTDRALVSALLEDARLPNNRLAKATGVAPSTALVRARALVERGVIQGFHAEVDLAQVGRPVQALVAVRLRAHDRARIDAFSHRVARLPEVVATYHVAGMDDYVLHVAVASAEALRDFVLDHLTTDPVVGHTETNLVFSVHRGNGGPLPT
jgi:DNA-binding Lrp family transcriptional regulator